MARTASLQLEFCLVWGFGLQGRLWFADPDPAVRDHAIREAAKIVQAAYREVVGG
jgi:hypothetical protein